MADLTLKDIFNQESIKTRAKEYWNFKDKLSRQRSGKRYNHIFVQHKLPMNDWINDFSQLSNSQQRLLIKGEIIRTYDSLPNTDKSIIKKVLKLSFFASKWYKLSSSDKKKIIFYLFNND